MAGRSSRGELGFRERSLFDGIARRRAGRNDLVLHSIGVLTPSLSALGTGLALPAVVGPGFWISVLLGFALAGLQAATFDEFASRFGSAGSLYTFAAKGLGTGCALAVAVALIIGYASFVSFGLTGAAHRVHLATTAGGGESPGALVDLVMVGVFAVVCLVVIRRGIASSARFTLVVEAVALVVLVVVLIATMVRFGAPGAQVFSLEGASLERILLGAAAIATLTVAFESSATLGLEARQPMRTVPASMRLSLAVTGVIVLTASIVGAARPSELAWSWRWFGDAGQASLLDTLVLAVLSLSLVALAVCAWTALARLVFSFAREGLLWSWLGRTDASGIPFRAALVTVPAVIGLPVVAWTAGVPATHVAWELLVAATTVMCLAYGLVAVAVVPFLRSIAELRPASVLVAGATALGSGAVAVEKLVSAGPGSFKVVMVLGVLGTALVWRWGLVLTRRGRVRAGAHDAPVSADAVLPR